MNTKSNRRGVTLIEVLVVVTILIILIMLLLPATRNVREAGRRTMCINKMHQLGLAMHNYASTYNTLPPSSTMTMSGATSSGESNSVNGWSFLVKLLPNTEYNSLYKTLPQDVDGAGVQGLITSNGSVQLADQTKIPDFICPSNNNNPFVNFAANPPTGACTNYKAMSATTEASLVMCVDRTGKPPYGKADQHPDGAIFPGMGARPDDFKVDGLSHTIALMETQDSTYSRWIVGAEASLVGLPPSINKTLVSGSEKLSYFHPSMYDGTYGDSSPVAQAGLRTFLDYDFSPTGHDYGAYAKDKAGDPDWDTTIPNMNMYGPSSGHPGVIVVGFADGNAMGLNRRVDPANLFFLITRGGGDPFNLP